MVLNLPLIQGSAWVVLRSGRRAVFTLGSAEADVDHAAAAIAAAKAARRAIGCRHRAGDVPAAVVRARFGDAVDPRAVSEFPLGRPAASTTGPPPGFARPLGAVLLGHPTPRPV